MIAIWAAAKPDKQPVQLVDSMPPSMHAAVLATSAGYLARGEVGRLPEAGLGVPQEPELEPLPRGDGLTDAPGVEPLPAEGGRCPPVAP